FADVPGYSGANQAAQRNDGDLVSCSTTAPFQEHFAKPRTQFPFPFHPLEPESRRCEHEIDEHAGAQSHEQTNAQSAQLWIRHAGMQSPKNRWGTSAFAVSQPRSGVAKKLLFTLPDYATAHSYRPSPEK